MSSLFSPPIFFIVLRETVESALIISVLLSFTSQLTTSTPSFPLEENPSSRGGSPALIPGELPRTSEESEPDESAALLAVPGQEETASSSLMALASRGRASAGEGLKGEKALKKKMDIQIWLGAISGFALSMLIGVTFIVIFYETLATSFTVTEVLWEGVFSLASSIFILLTGLSFVRLDRARVKWRVKLARAFSSQIDGAAGQGVVGTKEADGGEGGGGGGGRWALWGLPFLTVLREGLEGIVFVAGVAISDSPRALPLSIFLGIFVGSIIGYSLYKSTSSKSVTMHHFIVFSTCLLFLVGAGLFAKGVGRLESYPFVIGVGGDVAESGSGPGSYDLRGNVFHFNQDWLNPEIKTNGWAMLAAAVVGWNNNGSVLSILGYCSYWWTVIGSLVWMKYKEGRFGREWTTSATVKGGERGVVRLSTDSREEEGVN